MEVGYETFGEIYQSALRFIQDPSDTAITNLKAECNDAYQAVAKRFDWKELRRNSVDEVNFVAGSPNFYLPRDCAQPIAMLDNATKQFIESEAFETLLYSRPATFNTVAIAMKFSPAGTTGKLIDFSSTPEVLRIVSSSALDTTQKVRLRVRDANRIEQDEELTLNGTTLVNGASSWSEFLHATCDDAKAGIITISGASSGLVYARIGPNEQTMRIHMVRLFRPPSAGNPVALVYKKAVAKLVNDNDLIEIPVGAYLKARLKAYTLEFNADHSSAQAHESRAERLLDTFMDESKAGIEDVVHPMPRPRPSRLGRGGWSIIRPGSNYGG